MTFKLLLKKLALIQLGILFYLFFAVKPAMAAENFADQQLQALQQGKLLPYYSQLQPAASENDAYLQQQALLIELQKQDPIAGYKAGLTSKAGQSKFAASQPLAGVLLTSGRIEKNQPIKLPLVGKLMLETEIGFLLKQTIKEPLTSIVQLKSLVKFVVPVIELPNIRLSGEHQITAVDLIATNVAAYQFLLGEPIKLKQLNDINKVNTHLLHNKNTLVKGQARDALGDQWQALFWLINRLVTQGYQISPEQVLITGALGKMMPAKVGFYKADFGTLGQLEFTITD